MTSGASPDEWRWFDLMLGLTEDLLPVVCTPNLPISKNSTLKSYGKVPSIITGAGYVAGLSQWTSRVSTDADIETWSSNPNYGICLQTRKIRAIDVDVENEEYAARILRAILAWRPEVVWPVRGRSNSSKFLLLFELPGEYAKQRLATPHGIIEFLANGNQCVVAGTHASGVRYVWNDGESLPLSIPVLTEEEWFDLRDTLEMVFGSEAWSEGRLAKGRLEGITGEVVDVNNDPIIRFLREKGWTV